jgi:hypothetical protein
VAQLVDHYLARRERKIVRLDGSPASLAAREISGNPGCRTVETRAVIG